MEKLIKQFIKRKWDVEVDVPVSYRGVFDYKIPLVVKQEQLEYKIFCIPLEADHVVKEAILNMARSCEREKVIILALVHPDELRHIGAWIRNRVVLSLKGVWELIDNDVKLHTYGEELQGLHDKVNEVNARIKEIRLEIKNKF